MKRIGRYEVRGLLGRGGMGAVYKARAPFTGRLVALKILQPRDDIIFDLVGEEELKRQFVQEARIMGGVRHPHIAAVLDFDEHQGQPFFTMEYFAHSLGTVLGEHYRIEEPTRLISVEKSVHYVRQILLGLARLHYAGMVHRDIKPYNILLTEEDEAKIIDFGLSRLRGETRREVRGLNIGSPFYAAPEQEKNPAAVDGRADLFPVGVMLYRMLTTQIPEPAVREVLPPSSLNEDLDGNWDGFITRALAPDPGKRFSTAQSMLEELEQVFSAWSEEGERICQGFALEQEDFSPGEHHETIRFQAHKISYKGARDFFGLDRLWRPRTYHAHILTPHDQNTVKDPATGLLWQRKGPLFSLTWNEAHEYVDELGKSQFAGVSGWRLPTVHELLTLLRPPATRTDLCIDPAFDEQLRWIWSSDRCSYVSAWLADMELGYVTRQDMSGYARVCAVSPLADL